MPGSVWVSHTAPITRLGYSHGVPGTVTGHLIWHTTCRLFCNLSATPVHPSAATILFTLCNIMQLLTNFHRTPFSDCPATAHAISWAMCLQMALALCSSATAVSLANLPRPGRRIGGQGRSYMPCKSATCQLHTWQAHVCPSCLYWVMPYLSNRTVPRGQEIVTGFIHVFLCGNRYAAICSLPPPPPCPAT